MRGYWADAIATIARFRPGPIPGERVCFINDLFRMDEAGYFYFVSRRDDIIKCRGEKVAPKEVETALYGIQGVIEAAVIGIPDPALGQALKAFLVLAPGVHLTAADVMRHCWAHLEDFMFPKYVEFRTELAKTSSGKIQKTGLI
jgi:long-chain acyl-CoA synthetase